MLWWLLISQGARSRLGTTAANERAGENPSFLFSVSNINSLVLLLQLESRQEGAVRARLLPRKYPRSAHHQTVRQNSELKRGEFLAKLYFWLSYVELSGTVVHTKTNAK